MSKRTTHRLSESEALAKRCVQRFMPGVEARYNTNQSHGQHDFDLVRGDDRIGVLEVTAATDQALLAADDAVRERRGGAKIRAQRSKNDWYVVPALGARINSIKKNVDVYLADIEAAGLPNFYAPKDAFHHESVQRIWSELGVEFGAVIKWKTPGIWIGVPGPQPAAPVTLDDFHAAIRDEAAKDDIRRKLSSAHVNVEHHLFVFVDWSKYPAWCALVRCDPDATCTNVPTEISHLWAAAETDSERDYVVWRAERGFPWYSVGPITLS